MYKSDLITILVVGAFDYHVESSSEIWISLATSYNLFSVFVSHRNFFFNYMYIIHKYETFPDIKIGNN